ncbi:MAG: universal stress protein [Thermomicrobiales bacterium]
MIGFDRILVPLDGSERAEAALRWVQLLPARRIRLLQVCPQADEQDAAARYLAEVAARLCPPAAAIEIRVANGGPAEGIVGNAVDADLIVMCTQGAGGGGRLMFGSVADRVARHAPAPTLLLRSGKDPVVTAPLRRVVVPLDGSLAAERALPVATNLARMLGAPVHLIAVHDELERRDPDPGVEQPSAPLDDLASAAAYLEREAETIREHEILASTEVRSGVPIRELLATAGQGDLLVITTHGRGQARRWQIGRVAERLLRHAAAPIVLIRADGR